MIDDHTLELIKAFVSYLDHPSNAFGLWLAATGLIAGAYFLAPALVL